MPNDFLYRLRLRDPDDQENYVDVLVCQAAAVRDAKSFGQEYALLFDNSENGGRIVHSHTVENPADPSQRIEVERIDGLVLRDAKDDNELRGYVLDNNDPPPRTAESAQTHAHTHVVRYCRDNDPEAVPWVDVERIDCLVLRDAKSLAQEIALVADWPEAGDPIDDPDDPFAPRFCEVPESLWLDDREYQGINPPWRLDPLQNIVNVQWSGAVEFETDINHPHGTQVGALLPGAARIVQPATTIDDFTKITGSIWFNIPPDHPDLIPEFEGYALIQWGGRPGGGTDWTGIGYPAKSGVRLSVLDGETYIPRIEIILVGGVNEITVPGSISWYDDHGYTGGTSEYDTKISPIAIADVPIALNPEFFNRWHHLLFSIDASENGFTVNDFWIAWNWIWEVTGVVSSSNPEVGTRLEWNSGLELHGWIPTISAVADTVIVDIRPRHISELTDDDFPPASEIAAKARYKILYRANANDALNYGLYGVVEGSTMCSISATFGFYNPNNWQPLKVKIVLDGKLYSNFSMFGGDATAAFRVREASTNITPDNRSKFVIKNLEPLGIPRQNNPIQADDPPTADVRTRYAKFQIWFDTYVDLDDAQNRAKFYSEFIDPDSGEQFIRPASLTREEREAAIEAGMPPERLVSPAALAFGAPHIYLDGGPAKFPVNRGTGGEFVAVNQLEPFSPGPTRVPMAD